MILRMRPEGIRHVPVVLCSMCMQEIEKADDASFAYRVDGRIDKRVYALHNGCIEAFEQQSKIENLGTVPLQCFPIYFMRVFGIEYEEAQSVANHLSRA